MKLLFINFRLSLKSPSHFPCGRPQRLKIEITLPVQNHPPLRAPKHWRDHKPRRGTNTQQLLTQRLGRRDRRPNHFSRRNDHTAWEKETTQKKNLTDLVTKRCRRQRRARTQRQRRDANHRHSLDDLVLVYLRTMQLPRIP